MCKAFWEKPIFKLFNIRNLSRLRKWGTKKCGYFIWWNCSRWFFMTMNWYDFFQYSGYNVRDCLLISCPDLRWHAFTYVLEVSKTWIFYVWMESQFDHCWSLPMPQFDILITKYSKFEWISFVCSFISIYKS